MVMIDDNAKRFSNIKQCIQNNKQFLIIFSCLLTIIFFRADYLLGAVGLQKLYGIGSFIAAVLLITGAILIGPLWRDVRVIEFVGIVAVVGIIAFVLSQIPSFQVIWAVIGWIPAIALLIPPGIFVFTAVVILAVGLSKYRDYLQVNWIVIAFFTLFTVLYLAGAGTFYSQIEFEFLDSAHFDGEQYFLHAHWGWLGDPSSLVLYKCNSLGFLCSRILSTTEIPFRERSVSLLSNPNNHTLKIEVDGEIVYTCTTPPQDKQTCLITPKPK